MPGLLDRLRENRWSHWELKELLMPEDFCCISVPGPLSPLFFFWRHVDEHLTLSFYRSQSPKLELSFSAPQKAGLSEFRI
jgi:hypothetical protein